MPSISALARMKTAAHRGRMRMAGPAPASNNNRNNASLPRAGD